MANISQKFNRNYCNDSRACAFRNIESCSKFNHLNFNFFFFMIIFFIFKLVLWKTCYDTYSRIETIIDHQSCSLKCTISESERLLYIITDFSSLTQTLARLSPLFFDQG